MPAQFRLGKPLFWNGNPSFCCCACEYTVRADLAWSGLSPDGARLYGSCDGGPAVWLSNDRDPVLPADFLLKWSNSVNAEAIVSGSGAGFVVLTGSHSYRFWWANNDNANAALATDAYITVTSVTGVLCANGNTIDPAIDSDITLPFTDFQAPGDGDQSAWDGGFVLEVVCGACDPGRNVALKIIGLNNGFEFIANNPEFLNLT